MVLFHLSDLHIGKRLHDYDMSMDQVHILNQILEMIHKRKPQAVLIAGDIYDKSIPSGEAVAVFDDFLTSLTDGGNGPEVFIISGNHDSPERLSFASRILKKNHIHLVTRLTQREIHPVTLTDAYGDVNFYLMPFLKPSHIQHLYEEKIATYSEAVKTVVSHMNLDSSCRNVLISHQFFINGTQNPEFSDSESITVGGLDQVETSLVSDFDYVALGHIHKPQSIGKENIRYSGTPLKYSVSETHHEKSVTMVTLEEKGNQRIELLPLTPRLDVRKLQGTLALLTSPEVVADADCMDYVSVVLTDENEDPMARQKLRNCYPNMLEWRYDNEKSRYQVQDFEVRDVGKPVLDHFRDFFREMNGVSLSEEQESMMEQVISRTEVGTQ